MTATAGARSMRAFSLKDGVLAVREVARPVPASGQVLVRTLACAICASDHHYVDHPEVAEADRSAMRVHDPHDDVVMGHEYCGEVVAYGPDTVRAWPVGTRVTGLAMLMRTRGDARIIGMAPDAPGGFGEYFVMNEFLTTAVPDDVAIERVALNDAMAVGWYYTRLGTSGNPAQGSVPLVIGLGAIGLSCVAALKHRGNGPVVAADFSATRRALALEMGADVVVDPAHESPYAAWRRVAWGSTAEVHDRIVLAALPTQVVYECVGVDGVLAEVVDSCEIGTRVMSAGSAAQDTIPSTVAHMKGLALQFGGGPQLGDWYECLDLVVRGELDPMPMMGETVGLDGLPDAFERARSAEGPVRIVFVNDEPRDSGAPGSATPGPAAAAPDLSGVRYSRQSTLHELSRTRTGRVLRGLIGRQVVAAARDAEEARRFAGAAGYLTLDTLVLMSRGRLTPALADAVVDLANGEPGRVAGRLARRARDRVVRPR